MDMCATVIDVKVLDGFRLELAFDDGVRGIADLSSEILGHGGVFEPLSDATYFGKVRVDPELGTIVWPNGADFCPDLLHSMLMGQPLPVER